MFCNRCSHFPFEGFDTLGLEWRLGKSKWHRAAKTVRCIQHENVFLTEKKKRPETQHDILQRALEKWSIEIGEKQKFFHSSENRHKSHIRVKLGSKSSMACATIWLRCDSYQQPRRRTAFKFWARWSSVIDKLWAKGYSSDCFTPNANIISNLLLNLEEHHS